VLDWKVYKWYGGVPLYVRPENIHEIVKSAIEEYGSKKRARAALREKYRCFLSDISMRKVAYNSIPNYVKPPVEPELKNLVVMVRSSRKEECVEALRSLGVKINPLTYTPGPCAGFYGEDGTVDAVLGELSRRGLVDEAAIVNGVWYARLGGRVNLAKLSKTGSFVMSISQFKVATGTVGSFKVTVFHTGTVRIQGAATREQAVDALGRVYALMLELGALEKW